MRILNVNPVIESGPCISIGRLWIAYVLCINPKNGLTFCCIYCSVKNSAFILQSHLCKYVWHCHEVEKMPATCIRFSFDAIWSVHSLLICSDCYPFAVAALAECPPWPWASVIFGPWLFVRNQVNVASWPLIRERQAQWAAKKLHLVSMRRKVYRRLGNCYLWKSTWISFYITYMGQHSILA